MRAKKNKSCWRNKITLLGIAWLGFLHSFGIQTTHELRTQKKVQQIKYKILFQTVYSFWILYNGELRT